MGSGEVVGIGRKATSSQFCVDFCAAGYRVLVGFENHARSALTHDKTVAVFVEGTRRRCGIVVAGRQGVHGVETADTAGANSRFRTATDDGICLAQTQQHQRIDEGIGRRGTGRNGRVVRSAVTVFHGNIAAADICNHFGDEEGIEAWNATAFSVIGCFFKEGV